MKGKVFLVGAGPGDPELLTLKALRALKSADVVLHDELIGPEILALIPKTAQVRNVGKRCGKQSARQETIHTLLIQYALLGLQVVRLKGGDPALFGRAGEEIDALRHADIAVEIIPGVTAAFAAAAAAQMPLTHRQLSSALLILTGHHSESAPENDWPASIPADTTVVVYMPGKHYENTARRLIAAGLAPATPCAIISQATLAEEKVHRATLQTLAQAPGLPAPTLLIAGDVVRFADHAALREQLVAPLLTSSFAEAGNEERPE